MTLRWPSGYAHAAFVAVHGDKRSRNGVKVVGLLRAPPGVLGVVAHVVVGHDAEVERGGVQGVAVQVHQRAVADAVAGDVGVAVQVAAVDVIRLASGFDLVAADAGDLLGLVRVDRGNVHSFRCGRGDELGVGRPGQAAEAADSDAEVAGHHEGRRPAAVVAGVGEVDVAGRVALGTDAHVVAAAGLRQFDGRGPAVAEPGRGEHVPTALDAPAVDARVATGAVAIRQPHPAVAVVLQLRQLDVVLRVLGNDAIKVRFRLFPYAVVEAAEADGPAARRGVRRRP